MSAKLANVLDRLGDAIAAAADDLRNAGDGQEDAQFNDDGPGYEVQEDAAPVAEHGDPVFENTMLQVPAGDLWRLVNRSRKMIRLAREGKIPDMNGRGPLRDAIRALKAQGLVRKPRDLRA